MITAVGLVDPSDPRYQSDKALQQSDLRADTKSQLVEKAVGMMVERGSLAKNYDVVRDKLLSKSGDFVTAVVRESEPALGKDGLMSMTTEAVVDVRARAEVAQPDVAQRAHRVDPRERRPDESRCASSTRDADQPDAPPVPSPVAENLLKERIKSFGFRTWSEDGARADRSEGGPISPSWAKPRSKRLSMQLAGFGPRRRPSTR